MNLIRSFHHDQDAESFEAGEVIYRRNEPGGLLFVVLEGAVDLVRSGKILETVGSGGFFGEEGLLGSAVRPVTARAAERTRLAPIGLVRFERLAAEEPGLADEIRRRRDQREAHLQAGAERPAVAGLLLGLALLAGPAVADTFTVTNVNNSGAGSLRQAILDANADNSPPHTINFSIAGAGPHTISVASALPSVTRATSIDATAEQSGGAPGVRLDGAALASGDGIDIAGTADGSAVKYLSITNFPGFGIDLAADSSGIYNCYVGVVPGGATAAGNDLGGIRLQGALNQIGTGTATRNVVSGNGGHGISVLTGSGFSVIRGNRIGTNAAGTAALPNAGAGVSGQGAGVTVGGIEPGHGNLISGNTGAGVALGSGSSLWGVQGNYIGTDAAGTGALGNGTYGVNVSGQDHLIGSTDSDGRNVISGNASYGILMFTGTDDVDVVGNYIGTNAAGTGSLGTQTIGIRVTGTVTNCTIGGTTSAHRNVVSGNSSIGIALETAVSGCVVTGNYIGLNAAGDAAVGNGTGVGLGGSSDVLGGDTAGERNVISGNTSYGVILYDSGNSIQGNYIGTNPAGTAAIPNSRGIRVIGATGGTIGGTAAGTGNVISGNTNGAVFLDGDTSGVTIQGNLVGLNAAGSAAVPNGGGIGLGGSSHTVGGTTAAARNLISGNNGGGVSVNGTGHVIQGNYIGTNPAGTAAIANTGIGIRVLAATGCQIGGDGAGEGNLISGNNYGGIAFDGASSGCTVQGNKIGTNAAGTSAIANSGGVGLGGSGHTLGGNTAGARNVISGNAYQGVFINGSNHVVAGNYIGLNAAGNAAIGNAGYGIRADSVTGVTIGGPNASDGNVIAGNERGVNFGYGSHDNVILNNIIGLSAAADTDLADNGTGIEIADSYDNQIGAPGDGNVIAGMTWQGIGISGAGSTGNVIQGNWIGTNKSLAANLGNDFAGVFVADSSGNKIGGTGAGEGNVIAHNYQFGVRVDRGEATEISGNSIYGNYFGIDLDELGFFPNDETDSDEGANRIQNYPLIASALVNGGTTEVEGLLINEPETQYRIEFFSGTACGTAGFGDGRTFRGSTLVTTGPDGHATIGHALPLAVPDDFLTATVTDPLGNTSEFSPCVAVDAGEAPGQFQFDRGAYVGYENVIPTTKVFVTRSLGMSGTVSVQFTTSNSSATAGSDYTDSDQLLTFAPYEVVKIVEVPILYDPADETDLEKLLLALSSPGGGASLGSPSASEIQIWDYVDDNPGLTVTDAQLVEGDGGTTQMTFDVQLTATDHQVKVTFLTEPGSATEDDDYTHVTGELTFPISASTQVQQVQVPILGDVAVEPDEIVWLRITTAANGGNWIAYDAYGRGKILDDDDGAPSDLIFEDDFESSDTSEWTAVQP